MVVGAVVGGLLGWGLCSMVAFGPYLLNIAAWIVYTAVPNGEVNWILAVALWIGFVWAGILIGAIWFGRLGYRLGKRLHETVTSVDDDPTETMTKLDPPSTHNSKDN